MTKMPKTDRHESEILAAFEKGALKSVVTKAELARFKAVARSTEIMCRRENIGDAAATGSIEREEEDGSEPWPYVS